MQIGDDSSGERTILETCPLRLLWKGQSLSLPLETVARIDEGGALEQSIAGAPLM